MFLKEFLNFYATDSLTTHSSLSSVLTLSGSFIKKREDNPRAAPITPIIDMVFLHPTVAIKITLKAVRPPPTNGAVVKTEFASGLSFSAN